VWTYSVKVERSTRFFASFQRSKSFIRRWQVYHGWKAGAVRGGSRMLDGELVDSVRLAHHEYGVADDRAGALVGEWAGLL
jgi:hypothetical protein